MLVAACACTLPASALSRPPRARALAQRAQPRPYPLLQQGPKLTAPDEPGEALFGASVALSADGDTALVGAPLAGGGAGAAYLYTRSGSSWTQQAKLTATGEQGAGELGSSVALSGDGHTALLGAPLASGGAGAAYLFARSGPGWTQQATLTATGEQGSGQFGSSVALSGDGSTALVGARFDAQRAGAAYLYTRSGSGWAQRAALTATGEQGAGELGSSAALSGDGQAALLGAPFDDNGAGAVYAFAPTGSGWSQQGARLTGAGERGPGRLGSSVALSAGGAVALAGAEADGENAGAAWAFSSDHGHWQQPGQELASPAGGSKAFFGYSVALDANARLALIGGHDYDDVGAVWVLERPHTGWKLARERLAGGQEQGYGAFGSGVALSAAGETALVGGQGDDQFKGAAWVFAQAPAPLVTHLHPRHGPRSGGTRVRIKGRDLLGASAVSFGSRAAASFTVESGGLIVAVAPPAPAGAVNVTVTTPYGTSAVSSADRFAYARR